jgi:hypothetical protein
MRSGELQTGGVERYTTRRIKFASPFTLGKASEVYPAGNYDVETKEEAVERGGYTAHVRTATVLIVPTPTGTISRQIKESDLDEALVRDAGDDGQREPSENPDRGEADQRGGRRTGPRRLRDPGLPPIAGE